ncbi:MAG: hypothetical protein WBB28_20035 [Crinalium sp.]
MPHSMQQTVGDHLQGLLRWESMLRLRFSCANQIIPKLLLMLLSGILKLSVL